MKGLKKRKTIITGATQGIGPAGVKSFLSYELTSDIEKGMVKKNSKFIVRKWE